MASALDLKDTGDWKLKVARKKFSTKSRWETELVRIVYRPFDERWILYDDDLIGRSRREIMQHMLNDNIGLITPKQFKEVPGAFVAKTIIGHKTVRHTTYNRNYIFPLYIYRQKDKARNKPFGSTMMLFEPEASYSAKKANISEALLKKLAFAYKIQPSPEGIFSYIYAVLYSETYRTKYAEFPEDRFPENSIYKRV